MHALLADARGEDGACLDQPVEGQSRQLGGVRRDRVLDLREPHAIEGRDHRRERQIRPHAPQPERRRRARVRLERAVGGTAHDLVRVVPVVRRRCAHERGIERREHGSEQLHERLLGGGEVVAGRERQRRLARQQLEAGAPAGLLHLGAPALMLRRPAEPAGEVDDVPARVAQGHQRGRHAHDLVVGMRGEMKDGASHAVVIPGSRARDSRTRAGASRRPWQLSACE